MTPLTTRLPLPLSHFWEWQLHGECRTRNIDLFFPREGEGKGARLRRERVAKEICAGCPVTTECRNRAIAVGEPFGIWGGTSEADRRSRHNSTDQEPLNRLRRFRTSTEHPRPGRSHQRRSLQNVRTQRERHPEGP
ncbi:MULTISPECIES: WhiB family transcriptional regulator [Rhodococcus]|uniref:WhiB family transcriptional regulator n=1 Tax=Rhodococcus TaxID=1827 RepID=UPI00146EED24|nr:MULTISPECIES: WhiB family transcriptional regulator [Rhodococcus]MDI9935257.1 WhiB family transcriptional regulator [Rhodococcus sp. IEGM 1351]MDJ0414296.1 WhiB family transcriptional regulator [Rhodococcus opacus]WKN57503.1 WhiB family transcriptional regulator [Rhodococcus opacus]